MFGKAVDKHNTLMSLGMQNQGCDRHLFGLLTLAREDPNLGSLPKIFSDPSFAKRYVMCIDFLAINISVNLYSVKTMLVEHNIIIF